MNMISRRKSLICLAALLGLSATGMAAEPLRLLIIDGQNNHDWKTMTPPMKSALEATGRFTVEVATTPPAKSPKAAWDAFHPDFTKYDAVVSNYNGEPWPDRINKSLVDYVKNGGGLVVVHAANNAFEGWPEWNQMIGLGWRGNSFGDRVTIDDKGEVVRTPKGQGPGSGHGPQHAYKIVIRDTEHPITKGLPTEWMHAKDELYHGQRGPAKDMHILATAYSDKSKDGTGTNEPMLWVIPFGKGRVFTTVLGHVGGGETGAIRCLGFQTTLARGAEWAATGKVTLPAPTEFPSATKEKLAPAGK
jgi:type 1 glutamine amidotransferase